MFLSFCYCIIMYYATLYWNDKIRLTEMSSAVTRRDGNGGRRGRQGLAKAMDGEGAMAAGQRRGWFGRSVRIHRQTRAEHGAPYLEKRLSSTHLTVEARHPQGDGPCRVMITDRANSRRGAGRYRAGRYCPRPGRSGSGSGTSPHGTCCRRSASAGRSSDRR